MVWKFVYSRYLASLGILSGSPLCRYRQLLSTLPGYFPGPISAFSRLLCVFSVCKDSTRIPSASNTTSFARPPSSKWSPVVLAESLCSKIVVRPFAKGSSSRDKAIKWTLRLPPQRDSRREGSSLEKCFQLFKGIQRWIVEVFWQIRKFHSSNFFEISQFQVSDISRYKFTPVDIRVNNGFVACTGGRFGRCYKNIRKCADYVHACRLTETSEYMIETLGRRKLNSNNYIYLRKR